jgi:chromosome partitioning protein
MALVFAFMNLKGGVGKTVLAGNLAREFVVHVKTKILLVDLDPQCSLSHMLLEDDVFSELAPEVTSYEALWAQRKDPAQLIDEDVHVVHVDRSVLLGNTGAQIDLLPGSMQIYDIIANAGAADQGYCKQNFAEFIREAKKRYDYIFVDTNPSINVANLSALGASDFIVAPITMDVFAARGILMLRRIFQRDFTYLNDPMKIIGIWNQVDPNLRRTHRQSPAERRLFEKSPEAFELALTNRIYDSGYLDYRGSRRGFFHDISVIHRSDYFNRAKRDFRKVCEEVFRRTGIHHA